jgi:hypothetical protein
MATLVVALFTLPALAQYSRDSSASQKIDEAVNNHYLMMELDKAEGTLKGVIQSCEDKCSPGMVAKAWMYIGIVRGSGKNDLSGASEAFATAQSVDPKVQLDRDLASPETQATFDSLTGNSTPASTTSAPPVAGPPPVVPPGGVPGDMNCSLESGTTIATRMPIPLSCTSDTEAESAVLKFKEYGSKDWKKVDLKKTGDAFEGAIPCDVTAGAGPLEWFVGAKNAAGDYVDQYGSKKEPATFNISDSGQTELAYSDGTPAVRCTDASDCPPDFPGCGPAAGAQCGNLDWGSACKNSSECKCGLLCDGGTCNNAPSCTSDSECSTGLCQNGYCAAGAESAVGPFKRHWISASFAADSVTYGGEQLCTTDRQAELSTVCVNAAGGIVSNATTPPVNDGFVISQFRALLGYDYAVTDHIQVGARVGYIIGGNPKSFIPVHLEARFTYQFVSLAKPGFRALGYVGAGLGDMDFRFAPLPSTDQGELTVYKQGGNLFANLGVGAGWAFTPNIVATLNFGLVVAFPTVNLGLQPSLNMTYGF